MKNKVFGKKDILIFSLFSFTVGLIIGFFLAPIKKGMTIGCNNGNNYIKKDSDESDEFTEDLAMEMSELR